MLDRIITYSFYLLFFLLPLFWTSLNFELFEYNKMILTYGITVVIVGAWLLKAINEKRLTIKRTPLDIPLLLFLGANILSTIFSIDPHTSVWGYYSRSNGGLLSIISYLALYWAFVSNMNWAGVRTILKVGLLSGFLISLWAIAEHFGVSPSCIILRGEFSATCWVQDVQARVFATLGQPNWLAAYLSMLIFPALYFYLTAKDKLSHTTYYLLLTTYYLAFTFTYSRGPTLGLIGGLIVFLSWYVYSTHARHGYGLAHGYGMASLGAKLFHLPGVRSIFLVVASFFAINLLFGSALTSFRLVSKFAPPPRPAISLPIVPQSGTQLETGGTESGQIRFIVWKGALDIFKNYPIFGSGVETFAYAYYQFRPASHNLTSEWDFLYNKAHNEYLNYLATTGLVGFATYITIIITFIIWSVRIQSSEFRVQNEAPRAKSPRFLSETASFQVSFIRGLRDHGFRLAENKIQGLKSKILNSKFNSEFYILNSALLASYISYLIYNFFLFSVVAIAIFFYLFPALAFVATESVKTAKLSSIFNSQFSIVNWIYRRPLYTKVAKGIVIFSTLYLLFSIFQIWYADTLFAKGERAQESGNPGRAYNLLSAAVELRSGEPFYRSELGNAAAQASVALQDSEATLSAALKDEAIFATEYTLRTSPKNVSFWRTAVRTYFELATFDQNYIDKTLQALDQAITLAPTDPKLYYNKALILESLDKKEEAISVLQKSLQLKPNYVEARVQLEEATRSGAQ